MPEEGIQSSLKVLGLELGLRVFTITMLDMGPTTPEGARRF